MRSLRNLLCLVLLAAIAPAQGEHAVQTFAEGQDVGIDQRLGESIPLELRFRDEQGREIELRSLFGQRAVVLSLVYYECPMLCSLVLNDQVRALRALPLELGDEFEMVTVSIDPSETPELARRKHDLYVESLDSDASASERAGWHFLTGEKESIDALAKAVGFRYEYDAASKQYAHAAGIMVLTPDGVLSRYLYGLGYVPRDLELAIVDASDRKVGSLAAQILVRCFHYDSATGKYHFAIWGALRLAGLATVALLATFLVRSLLKERRLRAEQRRLSDDQRRLRDDEGRLRDDEGRLRAGKSGA